MVNRESVLKSNCVSEHRVGWFRISNDTIKDSPEEVMALLSKMLIVRAENMFMTGSIRYDAYSSLFEPADPGMESPEYKIIVHTGYNQEGGRNITFDVDKVGGGSDRIRVLKVKRK